MHSTYEYLIDHIGYIDTAFESYDVSQYAARAQKITGYAVAGEVLEDDFGTSAMIGSRQDKLIGNISNVDPKDKHSIDLLAAALMNSNFEKAATDIPQLLEILFSPAYHGDQQIKIPQNFLDLLLNGEVGQTDPNTGASSSPSTSLLTKFSADVIQLDSPSGMVAQPGIRKGLIVAAEEYYLETDPGSTTALFTTAGGGVHLDTSKIGAGSPSHALLSPALISSAVSSMLSVSELTSLSTAIKSVVAWDIQLGDGSGMTYAAGSASSELILGGPGVDNLQGGSGADILIGGGGQDFLTAGVGSDTLLGGQGLDLYAFNGTFGTDVVLDSDDQGTISFDGGGLGTAKATGKHNQWAGQTNNGKFVGYALYNDPRSSTGVSLAITRDGVAGVVDVRDFNLAKAESSSGYLGIYLSNSAIAALGTPNASQALSESASAPGSLTKDGSQTFSVLLGQAATADLTLVVKLTGANAADFALSTGSQLLQFANGQAQVTLSAGENARSFSLVNIRDPGQSESAQLDFSLLDADGTDSGIAVNPLDFNLSETATTDEQFTPLAGVRQSDDLYYYDLATGNYDSDSNFLVNAGDTENGISTGTGNDSITSGSGNDTISSATGDDTISAGGGSDLILTLSGDSEIYADHKVDLYAAIQNAENGTATGLKGAAIGVGDGNNTIVGGAGNDLISVGQGNNVIVAGPGQNLIMAGNAAALMQPDWSWAPTNEWDVSYEDFGVLPAQYNIGTSTYEGVRSFDLSSQAWLPVGVGNDTIYGGKGDSTIFLTNGDNYVDAGGGNDLIAGGMGKDTIFAGSGNVTVAGGGGDTYIDGESGDDLLFGEGGDNTIMGGAGNDTIFAGDDAYFATKFHNSTWDKAETGNNYIDGGSGNDLIYGSGGNDTLIAGSGTTTIRGGYGNEYIEGGSGTDVLLSGSGVRGSDGAGITTIVAGDGNATIIGGAGDDSLYGGNGTDFIQAGSGNQFIDAGDGGTTDAPTQVLLGSGNSTVYGGSGVDQIQGGSGNDTLIAGTGDTTMTGGNGTDVMYAGGGNDVLIATTGSDTLYGGAGDATLQGGSGTVEMHAGDGTDVLIAGSGNATLYGGMGDATLQGGSGDVTMYAGDGDEVLIATSGEATIYGGAGDDVMQGGAASTLMVAGAGSTTMIGGSGQDTFQVGANAGDVLIGNFGAEDILQLADGVSIDDLSISEGSSSDGSVDGLEIDLAGGGSVLLASGNYSDSSKIRLSSDGSAYTLAQLIDSANSLTTVTLAGGSTGYKTATSNGQGQSTVNTYDANGNELTASSISNDGHGNVADSIFSPSGEEVSSSYSNADGSSGTTTYALDGSSTTHAINADGTSMTTVDDGFSNSETVIYRGISFAGDRWSKADGSFGDDQVNTDGSSSSNAYDPTDGSTTHITRDAQGNTTTIVDASDGIEASTAVSHADGSSVTEIFSGTGQVIKTTTIGSDGTETVTTDDGLGNVSTLTKHAGILVSGSWSKSIGTHGTEAMVDGVETDFAYAADSSYTKTVRDQAGNTSWITVDATGNQTSSAYANANGSFGDTTVQPDGSTLTRNHHRDGSYDEVARATSGDSRTVFFSADGVELSETTVVNGVTTTTSAGVASAVSNFEKDGVFARAGRQGDSGTLIRLYAASGTELTEYSIYSPDLNAGYGGGADYHTYSITQGTFLTNGVQEYQDPYYIQQLGNDPFSQVGQTYHLIAESSNTKGTTGPTFNVTSSGQVLSTTTSSSPPPKHVTPSTLVLTPLGGSTIGINVSNDGSPPLYIYDQNSKAVYDLSGNLEPVAVANTSTLSSALSYVASLINTESVATIYTDGSTYSYSTGKLYGEIDDAVATDMAGNYAHYHFDEATQTQTWVGRNAAGDTYTATDNSTVIRYADGSIAESDTGSSSQFESQYDIVNDPFGNTISTRVSGDSAEDISVDSLGDVIKSDFSAMGSYGVESVNTTWTEADGTTVSISIDLTTGVGNERLNYTDGSYTVLQNDAVGNSVGTDYSAQGVAVGDEWAHADGSRGSHSTTADGSELDKWTKADGSSDTKTTNPNGTIVDVWTGADGATETTTTTSDGSIVDIWTNADGSYGSETMNASTHETVGSDFDANGVLQGTWVTEIEPNDNSETKATWYNSDGTVTTVDTITQPDGSYQEIDQTTDGTTEVITFDGTRYSDRYTWADGSYVTDWNSTDGSEGEDTGDASGTQFTSSWTHTDGTSGTDDYDSSTGERSGSRSYLSGDSSTYDTLKLADGAVEEKDTTLDSTGASDSSDTITQTNGSYVKHVESSDGSVYSEAFDAATFEFSGTSHQPGSDYVRSFQSKMLANQASEYAETLAYNDGTSYSSDQITQADGAAVMTWANRDGSHGVLSVGARSGNGDTFGFGIGSGTAALQAYTGNDQVAVGSGVADDQLWFTRSDNDLDISILGTNDTLDVRNWYTGTGQQVQDIVLSNGETLYRNDVQKLVDAMAAFAPPTASQTAYTQDERNALTPVLAANWH